MKLASSINFEIVSVFHFALKIWCAAGVVTNGGRTKDGGSLVGGSVFYDNPSTAPNKPTTDIEKLDKEIKVTR